MGLQAHEVLKGFAVGVAGDFLEPEAVAAASQALDVADGNLVGLRHFDQRVAEALIGTLQQPQDGWDRDFGQGPVAFGIVLEIAGVEIGVVNHTEGFEDGPGHVGTTDAAHAQLGRISIEHLSRKPLDAGVFLGFFGPFPAGFVAAK